MGNNNVNIVFLDAATLGEDLSFAAFEALGRVTKYPTTSARDVEERIADADVVIINKVRLDGTNLGNAKRLKLICVAATGFDNVDVAYCGGRGVAVCNVVGYSTNSVAQVTVSMALSLVTHLPEYNRFVESGAYTASGVANRLIPVYHEVAGMTWGIVGFGNIGKKVGEIARALGARVLVHKRTPIDGWDCVDFETVCREADILSFHTPLNDGTRGMLDRAHLAMMKPGAVVVNVARGAVIDEAAIAEAVEAGKIGGFATDVYSVEPMSAESPVARIATLPNVCLTPHMAWGGYETRVRLLDEIAANIKAFNEGKRRCRVD